MEKATMQTANSKTHPANQADERLSWCDSYARPYHLLTEMMNASHPAECVGLFLAWWNMCDAPWPYRSYIADELRWALSEVRLVDLLPDEERVWFEFLPPLIPIYRGCQQGRERGLSWTTEIEIAKGFAQGKRCTNSKPTLVNAVIPKPYVFGVFLDRKESEIVIDPRRLRRLQNITSEMAKTAMVAK
jgi:hypothetical protein